MKQYVNELIKVYQDKNILQNGNEVLLHNNCIYCDKCWTEKSKLKRGKEWNKIAFPYIGEKYGEEGNNNLMCIGLNFNEYGGKNAHDELFNGNKAQPGVINYLKSGKVKINFNNPDYSGTILWHRLAIYSNIILHGKISLKDDVISSIFEKIVFLEAIKCSPKGNKSKPEPEMINYCPENILFKEIEILKPKIILFLGKETSDIFKKKLKCSNYDSTDNVEYYEVLYNQNKIKVFKIIHPTARGGNSIKLYNELLEFRNKKILS
jgi:hypothetical protein